MTNFYVPLEIKNRDFLGRLLLSLEVCKKLKWNIYFGFRGDVNYFAKNFIPGIYHGLATIRNFENLYEDIKNCKILPNNFIETFKKIKAKSNVKPSITNNAKLFFEKENCMEYYHMIIELVKNHKNYKKL